MRSTCFPQGKKLFDTCLALPALPSDWLSGNKGIIRIIGNKNDEEICFRNDGYDTLIASPEKRM
jgi:hypothetical protein